MSTNWYYVENNERVGPVDENEFISLIEGKKILGDSYVWRKGFDNWVQAKKLDELKKFLTKEKIQKKETLDDIQIDSTSGEDLENDIPSIIFSWDDVDEKEKKFILRIGNDRGVDSKEYGPFSLMMIETLINQKRVNHLTQIFSPGMSDWELVGDIKRFSKYFNQMMDSVDRRKSKRCPITARVFLSDDSNFFQGVCRDVSIGGAQILVADFIGKEGDIVKINMHFDDGTFAFTAKGKVIRNLNRVGGFAMRFVDLTPQSIKMINDYVESYEGN